MSFISREASFTYKCQLQIAFKKYFALILVATAAMITLGLKIRTWLYNYRISALASNLYSDVKRDLEALGRGSSNEMTEKEIYQRYLQSGANYATGVQRSNLTFVDYVLPKLEQLRRNDAKISTIERM